MRYVGSTGSTPIDLGIHLLEITDDEITYGNQRCFSLLCVHTRKEKNSFLPPSFSPFSLSLSLCLSLCPSVSSLCVAGSSPGAFYRGCSINLTRARGTYPADENCPASIPKRTETEHPRVSFRQFFVFTISALSNKSRNVTRSAGPEENQRGPPHAKAALCDAQTVPYLSQAVI